MGKCFRSADVNQALLLPPSLHDWLPEKHLARFLVDVVDALDLGAIYDSYEEKDGRGQAAYDPAMRVRLLLYGYCTGSYSSRKIQAETYEDVGFRYLGLGEIGLVDEIAAGKAGAGERELGEQPRPVGRARRPKARKRPAVELPTVDRGVVAGDVAHAAFGEQVVAALHLGHGPGERVGGPFRVDHDLGEQVGKAVVMAELYSFRVDEDEADLVGGGSHQDRGDHRVDARRLAGSGGPCDQQVWHLGEVHHHGAAGDVPAERDLERMCRSLGLDRLQHAAESDELPVTVGHLDTHRRPAWDRGEDPHIR